MNTYKRNRKSIRLQCYDYSNPGLYFITICTYRMQHVFGKIIDGNMILNQYGKIAQEKWLKTQDIRDNVQLGAFVVMPNHMHAIFEIVYNANNVVAYCDTPLRVGKRRFKSPSNSVGAIVRGYKSTVTKQINQIRKTSGQKIWQRNYHEHIIRDRESLNKITEYIKMNPELWSNDRYFR